VSKFWLVFMSFFFCLNSYAHTINEVVFSINQKGNHILVEASFSWTIREALLKFKPTLEQATSKKNFEEAFFEYIQKHVMLIDGSDEKLELIAIKEVKNKGHSHGNDYLLKYKGKEISIIKNTALFTENKNQVNTHFYKEKVYKTREGKERIEIEKNNFYIIWTLGLIVIVVISLYKIFQSSEL